MTGMKLVAFEALYMQGMTVDKYKRHLFIAATTQIPMLMLVIVLFSV